MLRALATQFLNLPTVTDMSLPTAYSPQTGQKYQLFTKSSTQRSWEHCDYAADAAERKYLLGEYRLAYGAGFQFKTVTLPAKYWPGAVTKRPAMRRKARKPRATA